MASGTLSDINHVVLFMQENRAFDHYFGTMAGVRGFSDPNVQVNNGKPVWYQDVDATKVQNTSYLLPWYLSEAGGQYPDSTQCMTAGSNSWQANHAALNKDLNNKWVVNNTAYSWGYYKRSDLPTHFGIAENWLVGDMYQESVVASTSPNRATWGSGSINCPGGPQSPDQGGVYIDNNASPGCEGPNLNCYPLKWKTTPEYYQDAGVSWRVYQDQDNFGDDPFEWFEQFQQAKNGTPLHDQGMSYPGLQKFYDDCAAGTLPMVSFIVGPAELSEHPPYQPKDGAWLQDKVTSALVNSKSYKDSVLMISYDESGGWGDHVTPYHSPEGTAGEWMEDPYDGLGQVYTGPGFRLPFYIISPWTRGGNVFTESSDHNSQIKFVEEWLATKGHDVKTSQMPSWRREHMSDLTKAFDMSKPDFSVPTWPKPAEASTDKSGKWNGYAVCEAKYKDPRPPVPYATQSINDSLVSEDGFKTVRGQLTEGRFLVLEMNGYALASGSSNQSAITTSKATTKHEQKAQRFVLHQQSDRSTFKISSATSNEYIGGDAKPTGDQSKAATFIITDMGNGKGYTLQDSTSKKYWTIGKDGKISMGGSGLGFEIYSVTYMSK